MVYLDKFYTNKDVAQMCIDCVDIEYFDLVVEPSAGNGNFYNQINHDSKVGIDISPEHESIAEMDFFDYTPELKDKKILVIGNPPFGKICSLAIKFFNHGAEWADCIAFILPRTFRKVSIQNRLSLDFSLVKDIDIPTKPCSFTPKMNVKCCFQIWKRNETKRSKIIRPLTHEDFTFVNYKKIKNQEVNIAIRAYGGKCGEICKKDFSKLSGKSWHFLKLGIPMENFVKNIESINFSSTFDTARQNSLGRAEFIDLYKKVKCSKP